MLHSRVGILVRGNLNPLAPRFFDLLDHLAYPVPIALRSHLEMIDVHRNGRLPGDTQRLFQLFHDIETLAAQVNSVVAAVTPRHLGHLDDFIGILGASCVPRRGEAERPSSIACATKRFIFSRSAALAGLSSNPTTTRLICWGETPEATL